MTNMVAAGISFFATEDSMKAQSDALDRNAKVADFNAATTEEQSRASDQALGRSIASTNGKMVAAYAGSGVDTSQGSPSEVLADSIRRGVLDRATNKWNYTMQQNNYLGQAAADRLDARNIRHAAIVAASSAALASFNGGSGGTGNLGQPQQGSGATMGNNTSSSILNGSSWGGDVNSVGGGDYGYLGAGSSTYQGGNSMFGGSTSSEWSS